MYWPFRRKQELSNLKSNKKFINDPTPYQSEVKKTEKFVNTHIDSWDQVLIEHPIFNQEFLYSLIPSLQQLDFVSEAYIANNGLLRLNIEGKTASIFEDIALNPDEGKISMIRESSDEYKSMEDEIIEAIINHTNIIINAIEEDND